MPSLCHQIPLIWNDTWLPCIQPKSSLCGSALVFLLQSFWKPHWSSQCIFCLCKLGLTTPFHTSLFNSLPVVLRTLSYFPSSLAILLRPDEFCVFSVSLHGVNKLGRSSLYVNWKVYISDLQNLLTSQHSKGPKKICWNIIHQNTKLQEVLESF